MALAGTARKPLHSAESLSQGYERNKITKSCSSSRVGGQLGMRAAGGDLILVALNARANKGVEIVVWVLDGGTREISPLLLSKFPSSSLQERHKNGRKVIDK
jgi:hypothetical protein